MVPTAETHPPKQVKIGGLIRSHLRQTRPSCAILMNLCIVPSPKDHSNYLIPDLAVTCTLPKPERLYSKEDFKGHHFEASRRVISLFEV
jgi:Uma2 family endonuclease